MGRQRHTRRRDAAAWEERTQVFSHTKMCKFHLLGACLKGNGCTFAHTRDDLQGFPDLSGTKLCKTLINTGVCEDKDCKYAHNRQEVRIVPGFNSGLAASVAKQAPAPAAGGLLGAQNTNSLQQVSGPGSSGGDRGNVGQPIVLSSLMSAPTFQHSYLWSPQMMQPDNIVPIEAQMFPQMGIDMDLLARHSAMLRIGQAAEAHAAEAMRLQAMAAALQLQTARNEAACAAPCPSTSCNSSSQGGCGMGGGGASSARDAAAPSAGRGCSAPRGKGKALQNQHLKNAGAMGRGATDPWAGGGVTLGEAASTRRGSKNSGAIGGGGSGRGGGCGSMKEQQKSASSLGLAAARGGGDEAASGLVVKNTFLSFNDGEELTGLRQVKTCSNLLTSLVDDENERPRVMTTGWGNNSSMEGDVGGGGVGGEDSSNATLKAFGRRLGSSHEPAQINLSSLRSMSSNSLSGLDACAEEHATTWSSQEPLRRSPVLAPKPLGEAAAGVPPLMEHGSCSSGLTPGDGDDAGGSTGSSHMREPPLWSQRTGPLPVKNTFLDFGSTEQLMGTLRAVRTAAGRLDLMGYTGPGDVD